MRPENIEDCLQEICKQKELAEECDKVNSHKDRYSNPHKRAISRLINLIDLYNSGIEWSFYGEGLVRISRGNKGYPLIYSLSTSKWRQDGKWTWYRSASTKDFLERFVYDKEAK